MRLILDPEATAGMVEGAEWYERQASVDRALDFLDRAEATIREVADHPFRSAERDGGIRRRGVPGYPYGVFYRVIGDLVTVQAVRHGSRRPIDWSRHP